MSLRSLKLLEALGLHPLPVSLMVALRCLLTPALIPIPATVYSAALTMLLLLSSICLSQETVHDAISLLNLVSMMVLPNHFIYAKEVLCDPLAKLFTAMLRHGIVPDTLRYCILVPIPSLEKTLLLQRIVVL